MARPSHVVFKLLGSLFRSPLRWRMLGLLLTSFVILGFELWIGLKAATISKDLIDSLIQRNAGAFRVALYSVIAILAAMLLAVGLDLYVKRRLQMQARTALTYPWLRHWLGEEALYRLEREKRIDNPDQRIAEDLNLFLDKSIALLTGALSAIGGVWVFSSQLWTQGGPLEFSAGGQVWVLSGYLFWVAVLYSVVDFCITRWIAKPQIGLNMLQQHREADFRFSLVQVREHAEQVAFYRGEDTEYRRLADCFGLVRQNWFRLIGYQAGFSVYNSATGNFSTYMMHFLVAPKVLAGAMTVGSMTALQGVYGMTLNKLNWLANAWPSVVEWIAVVRRLNDMDQAIGQKTEVGIERGSHGNGAGLSIQDLHLTLPDGTRLTEVGDLSINAGERWLVRGPSGTGKSTFSRAIAGLWPHGSGRIEAPQGRVMFMPQKSYLPWDTLKVVLAYPESAEAYSDELCRQALIDCRLQPLVEKLHVQDRWSMRLSLGEQQRLAFARALLAKPDFLFLDEATSALDVDNEQHLYRLVCERLPQTTLVSVAHRPTVERFHTHGLGLHSRGPAQISALGASS